MNTTLDIGQRAAEQLDNFVNPQAEVIDPYLQQRLAVVKRFPQSRVETEAADGVKRAIDVRTLPLHREEVFDLAHSIAPYEPIVYISDGSRTQMGMLTANYDNHGEQRLPSIKFIPLQTAYPLNTNLTPNAEMATMLAGAASAERKGVGGHGNTANDLEHKLAVLGGVSLGDVSIVANHDTHDVRSEKSVATGLTDGSLGNLYVPDTTIGEFTGYGEASIIRKGQTAPTMYMPDSFLDTEEAFGVSYQQGARTMYGVGLQALYGRFEKPEQANAHIAEMAGHQ